MELDIRDYNKRDPITCIRVASDDNRSYSATGVVKIGDDHRFADLN